MCLTEKEFTHHQQHNLCISRAGIWMYMKGKQISMESRVFSFVRWKLSIHTPADRDHSTTFSVVSRVCQQSKNKGNIMFMDLASCPESFWSVGMYSGGCENSSIQQKRVTWEVFSDKLKAGKKNSLPKTWPLGYEMERQLGHSHFEYWP